MCACVCVCVCQHNESRQAWRLHAVLSGSGFSGPETLDVAAEEKASYPLTFNPAVQCVVTVASPPLFISHIAGPASSTIESEEIRHDLGGAKSRRHFELMSTRLPWAMAATATATPATEN